MFGNFIYLIIALLIYLTYPPTKETNFSAVESFTLGACLTLLFVFFTQFQFKRLDRIMRHASRARLDHLFHGILQRQFIMAIVLFAINIYGLNLPSFFIKLPVFSHVPTLLALLFIALFIFFQAMVWALAHGRYIRLYRADISLTAYVSSNISFSIPVLIPWIVLSGVQDLIFILPWDWPKQLLVTAAGQVIYFLVFLVVVAITAPALVQRFWRCKPLEVGEQRQRIERLCRRAGLRFADILYWPVFGGRMMTAGVMGLVHKFRYILVTPALLRLLDAAEIDAVIAHEIGHVKLKHLYFYMVFFIGFMFLSMVVLEFFSIDQIPIFLFLYANPIYQLVYSSSRPETAFTITTAIQCFILITVFFLYFRYVFGYFMRNFERQADIFSFQLFKSADPLISTLNKIAVTSGQPADKPNWHHYSIAERIDYLKKCEINERWVTRHTRKIRNGIVVFLTVMAGFIFVGYQFNNGVMAQDLNDYFTQKVLRKELNQTKDDPLLYRMLGDYHYRKKNYASVREAYEMSLSLKPDNPHVLNNLAWLYVTCEDKTIRNPQRALELAQKAAALEEESHILDTLAESYFSNGMIEEAVAAGKRALALAEENKAYYLDQLHKFKQAR